MVEIMIYLIPFLFWFVFDWQWYPHELSQLASRAACRSLFKSESEDACWPPSKDIASVADILVVVKSKKIRVNMASLKWNFVREDCFTHSSACELSLKCSLSQSPLSSQRNPLNQTIGLSKRNRWNSGFLCLRKTLRNVHPKVWASLHQQYLR